LVIGPIPERPAMSACQLASFPTPSGEIMPKPVTTTRRLFIFETVKFDVVARSRARHAGAGTYCALARFSM
jgi:hypothetical protein